MMLVELTASDFYSNSLTDDDRQDERRAGNWGRGDGGQSCEQNDDDVLASVEDFTLGFGHEDYDGWEVDCWVRV